MIRTFELSATPIAPADPSQKLPVGPTDLRDPGGKKSVAEWLARFLLAYRIAALGHVEAGRLAAPAEPNAEARAIVLANERLICGRQRTFPG